VDCPFMRRRDVPDGPAVSDMDGRWVNSDDVDGPWVDSDDVDGPGVDSDPGIIGSSTISKKI